MISSEPTLSATCSAGTLSGIDRGSTKVFKGIRFADVRRLGDPVDLQSWENELDATSFRPQAPQNGGALERMLGGSSLPTAEDCLYLNVYTPSCDDGRRPVLFWVHGGAFLTGGGAMPWYDGSRLAAKGNVVVVTVNYRLGALGYLGSRNGGTLDQVSALRWVARNIEAFGGEPANVTVFGESAGGAAVVALMATPAADDLFQRVWAMSPSLPQLRSAQHGERFEADFLDALGTTSLESVRAAPLSDLMAAQTAMESSPDAGLKIFAPTEGTASIPDPILNVASSDPRPLVVGTTRDESALFTAFDPSRTGWNDADIDREFFIRFGERTSTAVDTYRQQRPEASANQLVTAMQTDQTFRWPAWSLANERSSNTSGSSTWMYAFDFATPSFGGVLGSCHALDIPFAFDNLHRPGVELFTGDGVERQEIADQFSSAIVAFAHDDDPGWPRYHTTDRTTQRIGPQPDLVSDPESALRNLWASRARSPGQSELS
jgi:para-nitrobenzyl esterase